MKKRIITTENLEEDLKIENHLRPQLLKDYIGQEKAKETLKIYIEAAKERGAYAGKPPIKVDKAQFEQEYKLWKSGQITAVTAMKHLGLKPNTFYRRVKEYENG